MDDLDLAIITAAIGLVVWAFKTVAEFFGGVWRRRCDVQNTLLSLLAEIEVGRTIGSESLDKTPWDGIIKKLREEREFAPFVVVEELGAFGAKERLADVRSLPGSVQAPLMTVYRRSAMVDAIMRAMQSDAFRDLEADRKIQLFEGLKVRLSESAAAKTDAIQALQAAIGRQRWFPYRRS